MRAVNLIVLHHSGSVFGNACLVREWHKERGFADIGYHYVILNGITSGRQCYDDHFDGALEVGRPIEIVGAHALGYNKNSIGICLIGDSTKGSFTMAQLKKLKELVISLKRQYRGTLTINQHSELDLKKPYCAGLNMSFMMELSSLK